MPASGLATVAVLVVAVLAVLVVAVLAVFVLAVAVVEGMFATRPPAPSISPRILWTSAVGIPK